MCLFLCESTYTRIRVHMYIYIYMCMHTRTDTHTHTLQTMYIYTYIYAIPVPETVWPRDGAPCRGAESPGRSLRPRSLGCVSAFGGLGFWVVLRWISKGFLYVCLYKVCAVRISWRVENEDFIVSGGGAGFRSKNLTYKKRFRGVGF